MPLNPQEINRICGRVQAAPPESRDMEDIDSLLFGLGPIRGVTMRRLGLKESHTVDNLNGLLGINGQFLSTHGYRSLFKIRDAIMDPVRWAKHLTLCKISEANLTDCLLGGKWLDFLCINALRVCLYDLETERAIEEKYYKNGGRREGKEKKNMIKKLAAGLKKRGYKRACKFYDKLNVNDQLEINQWVQIAFFRRTSKLGITFTITPIHEGGRGSRIFFNLVSGQGENLQSQNNGLVRDILEPRLNRKITESELRYAIKLISNNPDLADRIVFYNERDTRHYLDQHLRRQLDQR